MGCDIHFYVEKQYKKAKREKGCDGKMYNTVNTRPIWISADKWSECPDSNRLYVSYKDSFLSNRYYPLFALLVDVRNDYEITPLSAPRGLPRGISRLIRNELKHTSDYHSHSWFLLSEIMNIDWKKQSYDITEIKNILDKTIEKMKDCLEPWELKNPNHLNHVRAVFWFDN